MIVIASAMASMQFIVIDFSQWQSYEKQLTFIKTPHSILIFYKLIPPVEAGGNNSNSNRYGLQEIHCH
jgi:hypothetical protein